MFISVFSVPSYFCILLSHTAIFPVVININIIVLVTKTVNQCFFGCFWTLFVSIRDSGTTYSYQGGHSIRNGQNRSRFTFSQKRESHHRSRSHFATPMMVIYRKWTNDMGTKWPNWNTNFARNYCEVIVRKGPKFLATFFIIERPPWLYPSKLCAYVSLYLKINFLHI